MNCDKDYFKGRIRTAIICDTKHKWDVVTAQFGLDWDIADKWSMYKENTAIIPETNTYCSVDFYKAGSYELVDFDYVDFTVGKSFTANSNVQKTHLRASSLPSFKHTPPPPPKPVKPAGDIIGVKVIRDFPNTDGFKVGTIITEYGAYKHKWKGVDFYKQSPDFFEFLYGYKPIFFGSQEVKIRKIDGSNCQIDCNGKADTYLRLLELRNAIETLKNFDFGGQRLDVLSTQYTSSYNSDKKIFKTNEFALRFGCTTGTFEELDAIIKRCERILTE